jgi:hypothetical protein
VRRQARAQGFPAPLARKLGLDAGQLVVLAGAPEHFELDGLPPSVCLLRRRSVLAADGCFERPVDVTVAFFRDRVTLRSELAAWSRRIAVDGSLWAAWPRRAAGHVSDVTDREVRAVALPLGLVDVKVAALGEDWSGLKLVWRRELRAAVAAGRPPGEG